MAAKGWDYWIVADVCRAFKRVDDYSPLIIPRVIYLHNFEGFVVDTQFVFTGKPLRAEDFKGKLRSRMASGARICCLEELEPAVRGAFGSTCEILVKTDKQIPKPVRKHLLSQRRAQDRAVVDEPCNICGGRSCINIGRGWGSLPCVCEGFMTIRGMTPDLTRSFYQAGRDFWVAKPWTRLRMNHTMRVEIPGSPLKFVQVLGGTGQCDIALLAHEEWAECQDEFKCGPHCLAKDGSWLTMIKAELEPVGSGTRSFVDLDYVDEQRRNGTPLPLPDSSNPDVYTQPILPSVCRQFIRRNVKFPEGHERGIDMRLALPTLAEFSYLTNAMHVVTYLVQTGAFQPAPGSKSGDFARYHCFSRDVPLPFNGGTARVQFPAISDLAQMSPLQQSAFAPGRAPAGRPPQPDALSTEELSQRRDIMEIKRVGNEMYAAKDFEGAFDKYTDAVNRITELWRRLGKRGASDIETINDRMNLHSNRAQAGAKLAQYEQVLDDCQVVLEGPHVLQEGPWHRYIERCIDLRDKALKALGRPVPGSLDEGGGGKDDAFDFEGSGGLLQTMMEAFMPGNEDKLRALQDACAARAQPKIDAYLRGETFEVPAEYMK